MYQLKRKQFIKTDLASCWDFFSSPQNLSKITPKDMEFIVLTELPKKVYEGLMIEYKMKPIFNIPVRWITEIKTVREHEFFIDEQRKGPYKIWHHEHHFKAVEGGVEMTDIVSYELPFGFLGRMMHPILVKKKLDEIFAYRLKVVEEVFV